MMLLLEWFSPLLDWLAKFFEIPWKKVAHPERHNASDRARLRAKKFAMVLFRFELRLLSAISRHWAAKYIISVMMRTRRPPVETAPTDLPEPSRRFELAVNSEIVRGVFWERGSQVVALVHGWEGEWRQLRRFIPVLLDRGFSVLAFDAIAHGESSGKWGDLEELAQTLLLLDRSTPLTGVVAHSSGGLALMSAIEKGLRPSAVALLGSPSKYTTLIDQFCFDHALDESVRAAVIDVWSAEIDRPVESAGLSAVADSDTAALIVHDRLDYHVLPREAVAIHHSWKNSRLELVRGIGHVGMLQNSHVVGTVADFMSEVSGVR